MGLFSWVKNIFPKHTFLGKLMGSKTTEGINIGRVLTGKSSLKDELRGAVPAFVNAQFNKDLPVDHTNWIKGVNVDKDGNHVIHIKGGRPISSLIKFADSAAKVKAIVVDDNGRVVPPSSNFSSLNSTDTNSGDSGDNTIMYIVGAVALYLLIKKK